MFRTGLCGFRFGYYERQLLETEYYASNKIPKELLYLSSSGFVFEDRLGSNYETDRQAIYHASKD